MGDYVFKRAIRQAIFLDMAIDGLSGAGKTWTSLAIAKGMGGRTAIIDTERGKSMLYADDFDFDMLRLDDPNMEQYVGAIVAAQNLGYDNLIIDSASHAWFYLTAEVRRVARQTYRNSNFYAWGDARIAQMQFDFLKAILDFPGNIIVTMRVGSAWQDKTDKRGNVTKEKVGEKTRQKDGIEYEFDVYMRMLPDHTAQVMKSRLKALPDNSILTHPGEETGRLMATWLRQGAEPETEIRLAEDLGEQPAGGTWVELFRGVDGNIKRPISSENLVGAINMWASRIGNDPAHPKHRELLARYLRGIFGPDNLPTFLAKFSGAKSVNDLSNPHTRAMLKDWLGIKGWGMEPLEVAYTEAEQWVLSLVD